MLSLTWKGQAPGDEDIEQLNLDLHELDYDTPKIKEEGLCSVLWRGPLLHLNVFLDFLHMRGFPCSGRLTALYGMSSDEHWSEHQRAVWLDSEYKTHKVFAHLIKAAPSRFDRILED